MWILYVCMYKFILYIYEIYIYMKYIYNIMKYIYNIMKYIYNIMKYIYNIMKYIYIFDLYIYDIHVTAYYPYFLMWLRTIWGETFCWSGYFAWFKLGVAHGLKSWQLQILQVGFKDVSCSPPIYPPDVPNIAGWKIHHFDGIYKETWGFSWANC